LLTVYNIALHLNTIPIHFNDHVYIITHCCSTVNIISGSFERFAFESVSFNPTQPTDAAATAAAASVLVYTSLQAAPAE